MKNWQRRLHFYSWLAVGCILFSQVTDWWIAELFSHFSFFGAIAILLASVFIKHRIRYIFMLCATSIIGWGLLPISYWQAPRSSVSVQKILAYNVNINNKNQAKEIDFIRNTNADIVVLAEAGGLWQAYLYQLKTTYRYGCGHKDNSPFALQVLSKVPLHSCQIYPFSGFPSIRLETVNKRVIYALHPPPPITAALAKQRNNYLLQVAQKITMETKPTLVVGDMNNTAFSPRFRKFLQRANLQMHTYRALPTWKPFFLPIDHALSRHTEKLSVSVKPLAWQFSDHRPLLIEW